MVKIEIHNTKYDDSIILSGETIMEISQKAEEELQKRGWKTEDCYSDEVK